MNIREHANDPVAVFFARLRFVLVTVAILGGTLNLSAATDEVTWSNLPIGLRLEVNKEHILAFKQPVEIGLPAALQGKLAVENIANSIYLVAQKSFPKSRVLVRGLQRGDIVVFDLSASTEEKLSDRTVVRSGAYRADTQRATEKPTYAELTRFASTRVYGPRRLAANPQKLRRVTLAGKFDWLLRGAKVDIQGFGSWRSPDGKYVTVMRIRNLSERPVELHPRLLRGEWLAATFQHYRLLESGSAADYTHLYLISTDPFQIALGEAH